MKRMAGQLIRMFLADGVMEGIKTLEVSNRTIFCTIFPRTMFEQFKKRKEYERAGVYILLGSDEADESSKIYIGEADGVGKRLVSHFHDSNKAFWTETIVLTSKDDYLNKTQIQYIESDLIAKAKNAGITKLENIVSPLPPNISEAEQAEVTGFIDSILLVMKALGYRFFEPLVKSDIILSNVFSDGVVFEIKISTSGVHGKMSIVQDKYVLLKDSLAAKDEAASCSNFTKNKRKMLKENNILVEEGALFRLTENVEFDSASAAANVIRGYPVNGLTDWKYNGKTLAEYEQEKNSADQNSSSD